MDTRKDMTIEEKLALFEFVKNHKDEDDIKKYLTENHKGAKAILRGDGSVIFEDDSTRFIIED